MSSYSDVEKLYIYNTLKEHEDYLKGLLLTDLRTKNIQESKSLLNLISANPFSIMQNGNETTLSLGFQSYGRFIEIRQKKKILSETNRSNKQKWTKKKRKKNVDWYTRNVFGSQNLLVNKLMYGLSDIERKRLKNILSETK